VRIAMIADLPLLPEGEKVGMRGLADCEHPRGSSPLTLLSPRRGEVGTGEGE